MRFVFDLAAFAAIFFILRYRVHFHIEYSPRKRRRMKRRTTDAPLATEAANIPVSAQILADLQSALVNLGAETGEADRMARSAIAQGEASFDALIFRAMQAREPVRNRRNPRRTE